MPRDVFEQSSDGGSVTSDGTTLYGAGAPANAIGKDGDSYVDTTNGRLYGQKAGGAWPGTFTVIGPGAAASPSLVYQAARPTGLGAPAIWVPTNPDGSPKARYLWEQFVPDPTPGIPLTSVAAWYPVYLQGVSGGTALATFADKSGNGLDLTQTTPANQPVVQDAVVNGQPVARFTNSNGSTIGKTTGVNIPQPFEIYMVCRVRTDANASKTNIVRLGSPDPGIGWTAAAGGGARDLECNNGNYWYSQPGTNLLSWNVWRVSVNGASSRVYRTTADTTVGAIQNAGTTGISRFNFGVFGGATGDIDWADFIVTNGLLSSGDRTSLYSALSARYGVA